MPNKGLVPTSFRHHFSNGARSLLVGIGEHLLPLEFQAYKIPDSRKRLGQVL